MTVVCLAFLTASFLFFEVCGVLEIITTPLFM